jgi:hypothetical protein
LIGRRPKLRETGYAAPFIVGKFLRTAKVLIRKEAAMYIIAAAVVILLIVLASVDLFLSQFNADELSNMGVEKR